MGATAGEEEAAAFATLVVPPGVAIMPSLAASLPVRQGRTLLVWRDDRPPLVWESGAPEGARAEVRVPDGTVLDVATAAARHRSAWQLLRASGKPGDGWLSRHVHRKISRIFSYLFLRLGLRAHTATFLTLGIGMLGAWLMAQTTHVTMIAGALLYWGASIADGIDGEMARLTLSESAFGEQLDTGVDQATHLLALTGAAVGWWRQGVSSVGLALAVVVVLGAPMILLWAMSMVRRARGSRQFFVVTKPIELAVARAAHETGSAALRVAAAVFILFRREAFSFTFFVVSLATGLRVVYPALVAAGLAIAAVTFLMYRPALDKALRVAVRS
jgi:phosphatidylserine synthase